MSVDITEALIAYTKFKHKDDPDRTKHLHVTDVTGRCPVGVVLEKAGIVTKSDTGTGKLMRFEVGHITEEFVKQAIKHAGLLHKKQKMLYKWPKLNMVGSGDVRIIGDVLAEVKSIHPMALDKMDNNPERKVKPHEHYVEQLMLYLSKERKKNPNITGQLFYFSLDGRTQEFVIPYDQEVVDKVLRRAKVLNDCIKLGKRPSLLKNFVQEYDKRSGGVKWVLNWKVKYCMTDDIHQHCDPKLWEALAPETSEQMIGKLEYQAKKANDNGSDPNAWYDALVGQTKKEVKEVDGITYEPVE